MKRCGILLGLLLWAVPLPAATSLGEAWLRVQQALASSNAQLLQERVGELEDAAGDVDALRLTPYARTLVEWASQHPDQAGATALDLAGQLDPMLPATFFLRARWAWRSHSYPGAVVSYLRGWLAMLRGQPDRRRVVTSALLCLLVTLGVVLLIAAALQTARFLPELIHDAGELGQLLFKRGNAVVFAIVVLALPLFAGLGPVWLLAYVFALSWVYMGSLHRGTAMVVWLALVLLVPVVELTQEVGLRRRSPLEAAGDLLAERRVDPAVLQDFANLETYLGDHERYHLLLGELLRLHGDVGDARVQFQKAALLQSSDPEPRLFLGNLAFEEGNIGRATQEYSAASEMAPTYGLAFYNLSVAYDRMYRFQDADEARSKARSIGREVLTREGPDGTSNILYPRLGRADIAALRAELPVRTLMAAGLAGAPTNPLSLLLAPLPLAFLATGLIGAVVFLLRRRLMWTARSCSRCGKVFCARCKSATESDTYCSQCISVFLKREQVPIEQQSAKMNQIRRWERWTTGARRIAAIVFPGGGLIVSGRWLTGMLVALGAGLCVGGALVWLPMFIAFEEPDAALLPVQVALIAAFAVLWLRALRLSWNRR